MGNGLLNFAAHFTMSCQDATKPMRLKLFQLFSDTGLRQKFCGRCCLCLHPERSSLFVQPGQEFIHPGQNLGELDIGRQPNPILP